MSDLIEQARKICVNLLEIDQPVNSDKIHDAIKRVKLILKGLDGSENILFERLQSLFGITLDEPRILDYQLIEPWIQDKRATHGKSWKFWNRYRDYLTEEKHFPPIVVNRLDDLTDKILNRLGDPDQHAVFDRRGMVVGHVQSGKTSNYIGLICKAADAGYKLIVVLAGIHNSLRSQTQLRVDEGFLGYDTETSRVFAQTNNRIGVGKFDRNAAAHSLTSSSINGDFRRSVAETVNLNLKGHDPVVLVIKKHNSVLKNLINWLAGREGEDFDGSGARVVRGIPMLLIDDEADNASINISKAHVSAINGSIRALLNLFDQSAYIGYTATPYANIFIEPPKPSAESTDKKGLKITVGDLDYEVADDLFPRNFIINLPPPSNYVGPEKIFGIVSSAYMSTHEGDGPLPIPLYRIIKDHQPRDYQDVNEVIEKIRNQNHRFIPDKHRIADAKPEELPDSLKRAVKCFILSCAARRARGQENVHNSMLVHVTRFVDWQNHIASKVRDILGDYRRAIEFNQENFLSELEELWNKEYSPVTEKILANPAISDPEIRLIPWHEIKPCLFPSVVKIQIRAVHGSSKAEGLDEENLLPLDYYEHKKGLSVIAIGGNKLSRGLTLEGLTISYYLRSSKMYDTLMQMGRWFGYRTGYIDLCRLFTSEELVSFYRHITLATEEMRVEFDNMTLEKNRTPMDYGLKVRTHPGSLVITAANKFRYKKMMSFSYSGDLEEMYRFNKKKPEQLVYNYEITQKFLTQLGSPTGPINSSPYFKNQPYIWYAENNWQMVVNYIYSFRSSQPSFICKLIGDYITNQADSGIALTNWTIALIDNPTAKKVDGEVKIIDNISVGLSFRTDATKDPDNDLYDPLGEWYEITKAHIIGNFHEYIDLTDAQLSKAVSETREDLINLGKSLKGGEHPNTLRIRTNRSQSNGLLLIYPLNPKPDRSKPSYLNVPIIGLAISFPRIEGDRKIIYAVNQVFEDALYDYPEAFDAEDTYGDIEEVALSVKPAFTMDKFKDLIVEERTIIEYLDDTEIGSGIVYTKLIDDSLTSENIVVPVNLLTAEKVKEFEHYPFYEANDIQRYITPRIPKWALLNPDEKLEPGERVIGLKNSRYTVFAYADYPVYVPDSFWVIRSPRRNARYLTALYNSSLFGAWVRISGQRKKDKYFVTNETLLAFPLVEPQADLLLITERVMDYITISANSPSPEISYFGDILDAIIFCAYYPISTRETISILSENIGSFPRVDPLEETATNKVSNIYQALFDKNNPVRKQVYFLDKLEKVRKIKDVFTDKMNDE